MQIGVDKDGTKIFCALYLRRSTSDGYEEWHGTKGLPAGQWSFQTPYYLTQEHPLCYSLKEFWPDGTATHEKPYYYKMYHVELPEEFNSLTWDDDAVDVEIVRDEEKGNMWLCRNVDGTLVLFFVEPHRNSVHDWWSGPDKILLGELDGFDDLTWEGNPIKVVFRIKK